MTCGRRIHVWSVESGSLLCSVDGAAPVAFCPSLRRLFCADRSGGSGETIVALEWPSRRRLGEFGGHESGVTAVAVCESGRAMAAGENNGTVTLWDLDGTKVALRSQSDLGTIYGLMLSRNARILIVHYSKHDVGETVRAIDAKSGKVLWTVDGPGVGETVAASPDWKALASGSRLGEVTLWDLASGRKLFSQLLHSLGVSAIAFSPDGTVLATASAAAGDIVLSKWEGKALRRISRYRKPAYSLAFSPDGKSFASADMRCVRVWRRRRQ